MVKLYELTNSISHTGILSQCDLFSSFHHDFVIFAIVQREETQLLYINDRLIIEYNKFAP